MYNCIGDYKRYLPDVGAALVVGGVDHNEVMASIRSGCDVIVATPGKITDLMKRGFVRARVASGSVGLFEGNQVLE